MLLLSLILLPLIGAIAIALGSDREARWGALGWTVLTLLVSVGAAIAFDWGDPGAIQFEQRARWIADYGLYWWLGADSVSMLLLLLTTLLGPLCALGSFSAVKERPKLFYASLLVLQAAVTGVFLSRDLVLFYVFFEFTLAPMYVLIRQWGSVNRRKAAIKFFLYTFTASIFSLAGIVYVAYVRTGMAESGGGGWTFSLDYLTDTAALMTFGQQAVALSLIMAGFAVKVPLFPVHTWLPLAHTEAPTAGSVVLAGVLLKLGTYAIYRIAIPIAPEAFVAFAPWLAVIGIIGILYAGLICWTQIDIKKLVAYSSVSHLGFCMLGLAALNSVGLGGSILYMVNHGLSTGALFLCIGMIYERYHTRSMDEMGGLCSKMPVWSFFLAFFAMASVGLPGLNGFVSEFMCMMGAFQAGAAWGPGGTAGVLGPWFAAIAAVGMVVAAIYILFMVGRILFGPLREPAGHHEHETLPADLNAREVAILTPLAVLCLFLGLYPTPVLRSLEAPIDATVARVEPFMRNADAPQIETTGQQTPVAPQPQPQTGGEGDGHEGHDHGGGSR